jgi:hypothetical protein
MWTAVLLAHGCPGNVTCVLLHVVSVTMASHSVRGEEPLRAEVMV